MDASTPGTFVEEASAVIRELGPTTAAFDEIADAMRALAQQPGLVSEARLHDLHGATAGATILAEGTDGSALMLARFPSEEPTPVHNHNSWAIICVVEGRDRHITWKRTDDGSIEGRAELRMVDDCELGPGDVQLLGAPPDDIHSQQGIDGDAYELVYFGNNPVLKPRAYFDPDAGTVTNSAST